MKKNIRAVMMFAVVALITVINVYHSQRKVAMSDIALANVEALADEEGSVTCDPDKGDTCMVGSTPVPDYDEDDSWW